jgi:hypothetical protein
MGNVSSIVDYHFLAEALLWAKSFHRIVTPQTNDDSGVGR